MANLKVEICLKKKNLHRAQIFLYFDNESRNKKANFQDLKTTMIIILLRSNRIWKSFDIKVQNIFFSLKSLGIRAFPGMRP